MSTVLVVTPIIITSWPAITAAVSAAVGTVGFSMVQDSVSRQTEAMTREEIEIEDSEIMQDAVGTDQKIVVERDGIRATFSRDARGALKLCIDETAVEVGVVADENAPGEPCGNVARDVGERGRSDQPVGLNEVDIGPAGIPIARVHKGGPLAEFATEAVSDQDRDLENPVFARLQPIRLDVHEREVMVNANGTARSAGSTDGTRRRHLSTGRRNGFLEQGHSAGPLIRS